MLRGMSVQIAVRLEERELEELDAAVARGAFPSRAEAVRASLRLALAAERERGIEAAYRTAYSEQGEEEAVGEAGLVFGARLLEAERDRP